MNTNQKDERYTHTHIFPHTCFHTHTCFFPFEEKWKEKKITGNHSALTQLICLQFKIGVKIMDYFRCHCQLIWIWENKWVSVRNEMTTINSWQLWGLKKMGPFWLWSLIKGKTLHVLTEERIVYLKVAHTLHLPLSPLYTVPFSDYNHN